MHNRIFSEWFSNFKSSISDYSFYVDFAKVFQNTESIKIELNILNSLIGSKKIESDFSNLIKKYPDTLKCIPILLAVRQNEIFASDNDGEYKYSFDTMNYSLEQYKTFMKKTGLFNLLEKHIINNLLDYVTGVEVGLDSNGRKNRGGRLMENLVEKYIKKSGITEYYREMYLSEVEKRWNLNLSAISNKGKAEKRFDFVIKRPSMVYGIETNFYSGGGSKLNETARSYKTLAEESKKVDGFTFVWITDGQGWTSAKNNLEETFDIMEHIYCIRDLENGIIKKVFI
ncbi:MAG: type II restriction endonuclease [Spirochaetaceae bacterium]|jgi:type II restriction enzyme|nr:type II restriction endonuclease [Spirochaetaceae bacterium]